MDDVLEEALAMLLDQLRDQPLTSADLRRETIQFVLDHVEDVDRDEVEAIYDGLYMDGQKPWR